ncbi:hypothetical protein MTO96_037512 [Rhipicephalus appendiculatus]
MQVLREGRTHFAPPVPRPLDRYATPLVILVYVMKIRPAKLRHPTYQKNSRRGARKSCRFSEKEGRISRRPFRGRLTGHPGLRYEEPPGEIATPHVPKEQPQSTVQNKTTARLLMESSNCFVEHISPPPVSMATPPLRPTSSPGNNGQTLPYAGLQVMVMNMPLQMQPSQQMSHAMGLEQYGQWVSHPGLSYEVPPGEIATPHVPKEQPQSTVQNKTTAGLLMESSNCFVEHMSPPPVSMATPPLRPTLSPGNNGQALPYAGLQVMVMIMPLQMQPSQQMSHAMGL